MSMSKQLRFDLPEDIVVRILIRLPVKSLIRFFCVSKRWRSVILSDPKFAKSHLQLASQQRTLSRRLLISTYPTPENRMKSLDTCNEDIGTLQSRFQSLGDSFNAASVRNFTFPSEEYSLRALASCNGVVLLCQYCRSYNNFNNYNELFIWNPSTGFLRKIPGPGFKLLNKKRMPLRMCINYGFGYVPAINDYILVFVVSSQGAVSSGCVEIHVFSLTANSWKVIYVPYSSCPGWIGGQGTLSNGAFHWVNFRFQRFSDPAIYAFDLAVEEFRQVPLPISIQKGGFSGRLLQILAHFGGCLCLQSGDCFSEHCDIWAMTEYRVPESWVKVFQFNNHDLRDVFPSCHCWEPCYVMDDGTLVIKLLDMAELVMVECRKEEKPVCGGRYKLEPVPGCKFHFDVIEYVETLISVS